MYCLVDCPDGCDITHWVERDGWRFLRQAGSHRHDTHATTKGLVTIAGHEGQELDRGIENSILKQAGLK